LLAAIPVVFGITVVTFVALELAPGDAVDAYIDPTEPMTPVQVQELKRRLGFDKPLPVRYAIWLGHTVQGDLGWSLMSPETVVTKLKRRIGNTVLLVSLAAMLSIAIGVAMGTITAARQYSALDYAVTLGIYASISIPGFFLGMLMLVFFGVKLGWFPIGGIRSLEPTLPRTMDIAWHLVLPTFVLGLSHTSTYTRYMRNSLLEVLNEGYIQTARAKGLKERAVLARHALKNAVLPVVTVAGLRMRQIFSGALLIEIIFGWPGIGTMVYQAIRQRDYPVVMGATLFLGLVVLGFNLLTDIAYTFVDPRIRYD
jgi:peptide/nickel transport system permease protein